MLFLCDENLPTSIGELFTQKGFKVEHVQHIEQLRGKADEAVFNYAVKKKAIIVTRDLGFTRPSRFNLTDLPGIVVVRFPNELSIETLLNEAGTLIQKLTPKDFHKKIIVLEPGSIRSRDIS